MDHLREVPTDAKPAGCSCHPDDRPIVCHRKHALRECLRAELLRELALFKEGTKRIYEKPETRGDMWFAELYWFLGRVQRQLSE